MRTQLLRKRPCHALRRLLAVGITLTTLLWAGVAMASPTGPDVSSFQHPYGYSIDWSRVHSTGGASFAFVKATEGTGFTSPTFSQDWPKVKAAGLVRGSYHFARPSAGTASAVAQARYYISKTGKLNSKGDLPPVLDLEVNGGLGKSSLIAWTKAWLSEAKRLTGRTPIIYTYPNFWQTSMGNTTAFTSYPLWIATYGPKPILVGGWKSYAFWQYTASAKLSGISGPVDMSVFNGSSSQLRQLGNGGSAATSANNPVGGLNTPKIVPGGIQTTGWGLDPDTKAALKYTVTLGGKTVASGTANHTSSQVSSKYSAWGKKHGFSVVAPAGSATGTQSLCVRLSNVGSGSSTKLGCKSVYVSLNDSPKGKFESLRTSPGSVTASGWALQGDSAHAIKVRATLDGKKATTSTADGSRTDIGKIYPGFGNHHGFTTKISTSGVADGSHKVCLSASNTGKGSDTSLGCRSITVSHDPHGKVEALKWSGGKLTASGWALDNDANKAVDIRVRSGNTVLARGTASAKRSDVAKAYPEFTAGGGFSVRVSAKTFGHAPRTICVDAVNTGAGDSSTLGCADVKPSTAATPTPSASGKPSPTGKPKPTPSAKPSPTGKPKPTSSAKPSPTGKPKPSPTGKPKPKAKPVDVTAAKLTAGQRKLLHSDLKVTRVGDTYQVSGYASGAHGPYTVRLRVDGKQVIATRADHSSTAKQAANTPAARGRAFSFTVSVGDSDAKFSLSVDRENPDKLTVSKPSKSIPMASWRG